MNDSPEVQSDMNTLLANLKKKADPEVPVSAPAVEAAPVSLEPAPAPAEPVAEAFVPIVEPEPVELYQQYASSRVSTCLITPNGKRINFTNYQYYTKDPDIIRYLDREIVGGLKVITKGNKLTADELNPEAAKKRRIIEEFKASQEGREFGDTKDVSERTTALSSDHIAN